MEPPSHCSPAYRKALELKGDSAQSQYLLAGALLAKGRREDAISIYRRLLNSHPNFHDARTNLAIALRQAQRLDEAIGEYRRVLTARPDSPGTPVYSLRVR